MKVLAAALIFGLAVLARAQEENAGFLEPGRVIKVSAPEAGLILEVLVTEGQKVEAGEALVRLDTRVLEQEAAIAEEQAKVLVRRLEKLRKLLARRYASEDEVARTESELEITRLRKKRAEAQMERLTLRSPIAGDALVEEVHGQRGDLVKKGDVIVRFNGREITERTAEIESKLASAKLQNAADLEACQIRRGRHSHARRAEPGARARGASPP